MSSFGEEIKRERELRGISLREISDATKINMRFLEALEKNDFEHLPGGQFNKGFIRAYANYIGVDPETMVNSYLLELSKQEEAKKPFSPAIPPSEKKKPKKWLLLLIIAAMIIVMAFILSIMIPRFFRKEEGKAKEIEERTTQEQVEANIEEKKEKRKEEWQVIQPISLTVKVLKQARIIAQCDGKELLNRTLLPGQQRTLTCDQELILSLSDVEAFHIFFRDQKLHLPEELGNTITNFKITTENLEKLLHGNT